MELGKGCLGPSAAETPHYLTLSSGKPFSVNILALHLSLRKVWVLPEEQMATNGTTSLCHLYFWWTI